MFFSFQIFRNVPSSFLLLISGLSPLGSEDVPGMTQVLLNLLRLVLWPRMWTLLISMLRALEKNMHSAVLGRALGPSPGESVDGSPATCRLAGSSPERGV